MEILKQKPLKIGPVHKKEDDLFYNSNRFNSQNTPDEEEPADTQNATKQKEELVNIIRAKLNDDQFKEWERLQDIIKANPILAECVVDLINVLQAW